MDSKDRTRVRKTKGIVESLEFAWTGIKTALKEERNLRIHGSAALVAVLFGWLFRLNRNEWLWLILAIFLVWVAEIVNTIFENMVDLVTNHHFHPIAKKVKDMAAGVVLLAALFAIIVGGILFLPKFYLLFFT